MSTTKYLDSLNIDQLRFAREEADRRIKQAESSPKKIVWNVGGGLIFGQSFKEEDSGKALEFYKKAIDDTFNARLIEEIMNREISPPEFRSYTPSLSFIYVNEVEYEEFFSE